MSMAGYEVHSCEECSASDYHCFMKQRGEFWYCKECDPGAEPEPDAADQLTSEDR